MSRNDDPILSLIIPIVLRLEPRITFLELCERGFAPSPAIISVFPYDCGVFNRLPDEIQHVILEEFLFDWD